MAPMAKTPHAPSGLRKAQRKAVALPRMCLMDFKIVSLRLGFQDSVGVNKSVRESTRIWGVISFLEIILS